MPTIHPTLNHDVAFGLGDRSVTLAAGCAGIDDAVTIKQANGTALVEERCDTMTVALAEEGEISGTEINRLWRS
jgi:hypothetical protein